ncbi:MAG: erythromycin esterase family protein [Lachnospiraceae bacterium]|nr:erythromycin esterase family protein [Lachnospiraceae bacterium]
MKKCKNRMKKILCWGTVALTLQGALTGCGSKSGTEMTDFAAYVQDVESIGIPEEVRIVALGEATHGNKEFQELKLDVFAHLVETTSVRAFALEGDFGGCALANRYILNDEGTAEEAVKKLGFQIYRTDQMLELVQWMHDYNLKASPENKVRFYGFDMQRDLNSLELIKDFYEGTAPAKAMEYSEKLSKLYGEEEYTYDKSDLPEIEKLLKDIVKDLEENEAGYAAKDEEAYAYALQGAKCLLQNLELQDAGSNYSEIRDKNMNKNVKWILEREENKYGTKLMISGHNGHVAKVVNSSYTNMGSYLYEEMGREYFVIGTDFYNTTCNLPEGDGRSDFEFCSDDPLAEAVGDLEKNIYFLDFTNARESKELSKLIDASVPTGSLGESYSPLMKVMKSTYQINIAPGKLYDGMILVYEATPIQVWDYIEK